MLREKGSNKYRTCGYNKTREIEKEGKLNIKAKSRWRGKKILEKTFLYSHTHIKVSMCSSLCVGRIQTKVKGTWRALKMGCEKYSRKKKISREVREIERQKIFLVGVWILILEI